MLLNVSWKLMNGWMDGWIMDKCMGGDDRFGGCVHVCMDG